MVLTHVLSFPARESQLQEFKEFQENFKVRALVWKNQRQPFDILIFKINTKFYVVL